MIRPYSSPLVSCTWLHANINAPNTRILDATFFLPRQQRNGLEEFTREHIPGALFFDIDQVADLSNPLPHTLPTVDTFAAEVGNLGINNTTQIIVYDNNAFFAAARTWWMFRVFGHDNIRVLDGGLKRWKTLGLPLSYELINQQQQIYTCKYVKNLVCDLAQMQRLAKNKTHQILDARSPKSFLGNHPDSSTKQNPGHIPGSRNIYYAKLSNNVDHTLRPQHELELLFKNLSVDIQQPIVTTCGSGVSAAVLAMSLYQLGVTTVPVYDGSWAEWRNQKTQTQ